MHLIMNALEEVTSRAHSNVSEISLLITHVSASAGFEPPEKSHRITETHPAYSCAHHSSSVPAVSHDPSSSPAPSKEVVNNLAASRRILTPVI